MFIFNSQEKIYQETKKQIEDLFKEFKMQIFDEVDLGVKKFAYQINKHDQGHYYIYYVKTAGISINQMNKELKLKESLLRHMFVHLDKFAKEDYLKKKKESKMKAIQTTEKTASTTENENTLENTPVTQEENN